MSAEKPSRRQFFKKAPHLFWLAPAAWLLSGLVRRTEETGEIRERTVELPLESGEAVRFAEEVILIRVGNGFRAFSAACTHMGCRIQRVEGEELVCPCHGSRFNMSGEVLRGPAERPLARLRCEADERAGVLRITVRA